MCKESRRSVVNITGIPVTAFSEIRIDRKMQAAGDYNGLGAVDKFYTFASGMAIGKKD